MITVELICVVAGLIIAPAVTAMHKIGWVERYKKWVAFGLSVLTAVVSELTIGGLDWKEIVACTLVPFATAVTTFEVAIKPAVKAHEEKKAA